METVISRLIQAAFTSDEQAWFEVLGMQDTNTDDDLEQFLTVNDAVN